MGLPKWFEKDLYNELRDKEMEENIIAVWRKKLEKDEEILSHIEWLDFGQSIRN